MTDTHLHMAPIKPTTARPPNEAPGICDGLRAAISYTIANSLVENDDGTLGIRLAAPGWMQAKENRNMSEIKMPSFPAGTRREETAQARAEMVGDFFKPESDPRATAWDKWNRGDMDGDNPLSNAMDQYWALAAVLREAYQQASQGKGRERHATDEPFERQSTVQAVRAHGIGLATGQAEKKGRESHRLLPMENGRERAVAELLGAINYLAMAIIVIREGK